MQGPEAVTFENVTLAHFLDKAQQLAACAEQVKALDAQVRMHAPVSVTMRRCWCTFH